MVINMKKRLVLAGLLIFCVIFSAVPVFATSATTQTQNDKICEQWKIADEEQASKIAEAKKYAYMDLDSATSDMKERILAARETIIYSRSWAADGCSVSIQRADGTEEFLPQFSELFPGWDIPTVDSLPAEDIDEPPSEWTDLPAIEPPYATPMATAYQYCSPYLKHPSDSNTAPFFAFNHNGMYVRTTVYQLNASEHCNIGYSNYTTGQSLCYGTYLYPNESLQLYTLGWSPFVVGIRASTYSSPGYSTMLITADYPDDTVVSTGDISK